MSAIPISKGAPTLLYHGSPTPVPMPSLDKGKPHNDYGRGFYCTEEFEKACEWACKQKADGFANAYELDGDGLAVLDLLDGTHTVLEWIALLLANRTFRLGSELARDASDYLLASFLPDTAPYDVIRGYRADDSYFSFAEAFVEGTLSIDQLARSLYLGKLGVQVVLVSPRAFDHLRFVEACSVQAEAYYPKFVARDEAARQEYRSTVRGAHDYRDGLFVLDLMRKEVAPDDPRIQRMLPE